MTSFRLITDGARVLAEFDAPDRPSAWREGTSLAEQHSPAETARGGYELTEWTGTEWRVVGQLSPDPQD
jgi:hypothetical protein